MNNKVRALFHEQVMSNPKYQIMIKRMKKMKKGTCTQQLTTLLKLMSQEKKYRANINVIRRYRAVHAFKWMAKKKKITVKDKSKFGSLLLVAAVLKDAQSTKPSNLCAPSGKHCGNDSKKCN